MGVNLGTLAGIITRGDRVCNALRCVNVPEAIARLKRLINDPTTVGVLLDDLDALDQHLRALKHSELQLPEGG